MPTSFAVFEWDWLQKSVRQTGVTKTRTGPDQRTHRKLNNQFPGPWISTILLIHGPARTMHTYIQARSAVWLATRSLSPSLSCSLFLYLSCFSVPRQSAHRAWLTKLMMQATPIATKSEDLTVEEALNSRLQRSLLAFLRWSLRVERYFFILQEITLQRAVRTH